MINDFAGIIKEARKEQLSMDEINIIEEINISINKKGQIEERGYYQPIESRIQLTFESLTGHPIERGGALWRNIQSLKTERDIYQHRIGKGKQEELKLDSSIPIDGMEAVKTIICTIFAKTPEFSDKFVYKFYEFWSCKTDSPFMWDGKCGCGFSMGKNVVSPDDMINVFAPMPNMINEASESMCPSRHEEDGMYEECESKTKRKVTPGKRKKKAKKVKRKK